MRLFNLYYERKYCTEHEEAGESKRKTAVEIGKTLHDFCFFLNSNPIIHKSINPSFCGMTVILIIIASALLIIFPFCRQKGRFCLC
jgi:hypothetical protein